MLLHLALYILGIASATFFEAGRWVSKASANRWRDFIRMNSGEIATHAISAVVFFPVWDGGDLLWIGHQIYVKGLGAIGITGTTDVPGIVSGGSSFVAGFSLDFVAIFIVMMLRNLAARRAKWVEKRWSPPPSDDQSDIPPGV